MMENKEPIKEIEPNGRPDFGYEYLDHTVCKLSIGEMLFSYIFT